MPENADLGKYYYCRYGTGFDERRFDVLSDNSEIGKNVILFGTDVSSYVHAGKRKRYFNSW